MQNIHEKEKRDYGFDNIRALLIICVVFAHLLEIRNPFPFGDDLYRVIYSFHMPTFLFICGWFARFNKMKILFGLFIPYLMFQTVYIIFQRWLYDKDVMLQYTTPYWLLWFLLALLVYHLLLPIYDVGSPKKQMILWTFTLVLSLIVGCDSTVGYSMSLSRIFVFQPWFLMGFYARRTLGRSISKLIKRILIGGLGVCIVVLCCSSISNEMLYGSYPYDALHYHAGIRLFLTVAALMWILILCFVLRPLMSIRIPLITTLGQNTLFVFLLHGFIVKYIGYRHPYLLETCVGFLLVTCLILVLICNPITNALFRRLMPEYLINKYCSTYCVRS